MTSRIVGVVGAGTMGNGIAQVFAQAGFNVILTDVSQTALDRGLAAISSSLSRLVKKGVFNDNEAVSVLSRIRGSTQLAELAGCELVVEAATENAQTKEQIFRQLADAVPADTILASNTSSISLTTIASWVKKPERVIGMHFMNPVPVMQLVEVIRGLATSDETHATTVELARRMGKTPAEANDFPGFIANRILLPMINEAIFCLYQSVGDRESIDTVMKLGMNHPMGPLALADLIGLDTCLAILETLHRGLGDPKYRPCPLLRQYVEAGWLGRKSGRGFYQY